MGTIHRGVAYVSCLNCVNGGEVLKRDLSSLNSSSNPSIYPVRSTPQDTINMSLSTAFEVLRISDPLEMVPDDLTEDQHQQLDRELFDDFPNDFPGIHTIGILVSGCTVLDASLLHWNNIKKLVAAYPSLEGELKRAWESGSLKNIRLLSESIQNAHVSSQF